MERPLHQPHSGRRFDTATDANTSMTPSHPNNPRSRFNMMSLWSAYPRQRSESTDLAVRNRPNVMKLR